MAGAAELAKRIGWKRQKISDIEIGKVKISIELALVLEEKLNVSFRWALTGQGEIFDGEEATVEATEESQEISKLLAQAKRVLTSGNQQAMDALGKNIQYFAHAIEVERRLSKLEEEMDAIKALIRSKSPPEAESPREEAI